MSRRPATDPAGPTGKVATWLADLTLDAVPERVRERAKYLTLDGIACALVGAQLPWSQKAVEIVSRLEALGAGTIIGHGRGTSPPAAVLLNGTFIQGFELDDYHQLGPLHSASVVIPPLLAFAETTGAVSGRDFLLAALAGYEVGPRVGMALRGGQMLSRGWHSGSVFGTHASAAATGKLHGLDPAGFEDALGLAGTQSAGLMAAQFEAMSKRMHHGFSARNGYYAAGLAAGGYTGIKRVFEREYGGFLATFGEGHAPLADQVADGLGERWETERISIKPYAAMGGTHAAIDAVFELKQRHPFVADDIVRIEIAVGHAVFHHGWWKPERPLTEIGAQMNIGYCVGVALIDGEVMPAQFTRARMDRDDVWSLLSRTDVRHDEAIDRLGAGARQKTQLRLTLRDGSVLEAEVTVPSGGIHKPLSNDEILRKFRRLTARIVDPARQEAVERAVLAIEGLNDTRDLIALLAAPVGSPLESAN